MYEEQPIMALLREQERSLSWLARKIGWTSSHTWQICTGHRRPSRKFMRDCARFLEVPADQLFRPITGTIGAGWAHERKQSACALSVPYRQSGH